VEATALNAEAILEGVRNGRTVVQLTGADGPMIVLDAPGREGSIVPVLVEADDSASAPLVDVTATVTGGAGHTLFWVTEGQLEQAVEVTTDNEVVTLATGLGRVRAELWSGDDPVTMTSHLVVTEAQAPAPAQCGCTTSLARKHLRGGRRLAFAFFIVACFWRASPRQRRSARRD